MKNNINNRKRKNNIDKQKKLIIFGIVTLVVVLTGALSAQRISKRNETVKASEIVNDVDNESNKPVLDNSGYLPLGEDPFADDAAFVEKYLNQQAKGQMPEGADGKKVVYLTFDDGPSENVTPQILSVLKEKNVKATFFTVGKSINQSEVTKSMLKQEVEDGHAIGNHTYSHDYKYLYPNHTVSVENFMNDVEKSNEALRAVLGKDFSTRAIRFPGGHMSWKGQKPIDEKFIEKGYNYIDWNSLSKDAEGKHKVASELLEQVKQTVGEKEKAVILMHDCSDKGETAKALPEIIDYLTEKGYTFRTIK
ncbi:polysaccharide deacetylase family protein [Clostridium uliginosum]|uniref:Peptidoglycan/xylan/chitin deacetylase, PgdA/CDA1 family n=1 Tax=Clostridium uliginosum TaxID=119641 RepID=A0A1I1IDN2_9CLOT|nr:polysaccharide deacetylase family protein [Clostridium uliginosum]SFC34427.1 Peptidoglycan/xylan/chitin deacetylase, PgdA/CDA1 family [Clostridium uliginosum]